jgi:maltose alpha-D-glucosyltransferase/alpha-amylase
MRRIIEVRKAHQVFGRGGIEFLHPGNRKILAYVREGGGELADGEAVLCVANLARGAQPVELDLARFQGRVPIELLGQTPFPPIGALPYLLTLPGHGFYWFLLSKDADAPAWHEEHLPAQRLATLVLPEGWRSLQPRRAQRQEPALRALALLQDQLLPDYLNGRPWRAAGGRLVRAATIEECEVWDERLLTLVRAELEDGTVIQLFLPLSILWQAPDTELTPSPVTARTLARVRRHATQGLLFDALADPVFIRDLVQAIGRGGELEFGDGRLLFEPTTAFERLAGDCADAPLSRPPDDHSSSAVLGERLLLKTVRRVPTDDRSAAETALDPSIELGRFLTEVSPFPNIPALAGRVAYRAAKGSLCTLAVLEEYVPNQGNLWHVTRDLLGRLRDAYGQRHEDWCADPAQLSYAALIDILGRRAAELHQALARPGGGEGFDPEPFAEDERGPWRDSIRQNAEDVLAELARQVEDLPDPDRDAAEALLARAESISATLADLSAFGPGPLKMRVHGDLWLPRVLVAEDDVVFIGAGGSPDVDRTIRRAKRSPLGDLGRLVCSLHLAVAAVARSIASEPSDMSDPLREPLNRWRGEMVRRLVTAYGDKSTGSAHYPESSEQARSLVRLFALSSGIDALRDGLQSQPEFRSIAMAALMTLLETDLAVEGVGALQQAL